MCCIVLLTIQVYIPTYADMFRLAKSQCDWSCSRLRCTVQCVYAHYSVNGKGDVRMAFHQTESVAMSWSSGNDASLAACLAPPCLGGRCGSVTKEEGRDWRDESIAPQQHGCPAESQPRWAHKLKCGSSSSSSRAAAALDLIQRTKWDPST